MGGGSVFGHCDGRFSRVRDVFTEAIAGGLELGAATSAFVDGVEVVDLWGGFSDRAKTKPWGRDTLVNVYSVTKAFTAISAHRVFEDAGKDLDAAIADEWPTFAA